MFGRVRAASSTVDSLELERPPSKLIKDDSLSIYEATLIKLKLGSQRDLGSPPPAMTQIDSTSSSNCAEENCTSLNVLNSSQLLFHHNEMMIDSNFSSVSISTSSSDCQSAGSLQHHPNRNLSILYLFSKFKSRGQAESSSQEENLVIQNDGSSVSISPSSSIDFQSSRST